MPPDASRLQGERSAREGESMVYDIDLTELTFFKQRLSIAILLAEQFTREFERSL